MDTGETQDGRAALDPARTVIVSATGSESAHVPAGLNTVVCGIGKVDAAAATTAAVLRAGERAGGAERVTVVNIGTAGALREGHAGLYIPSMVCNHDISADVLRELHYPVVDDIGIDGGDGSVLATGDVFVTDPVVRGRLARRADLVDMEGFAVARACMLLDARVRLVKYVSDDADDSAMDWPARVDHCARALGGWLAARLG